MSKHNLIYDIVVVGGGPAGLAAAISAKEHGVEKILIVDREKELGGILQQCIHNGFGLHIFKEELTGPEYAERFIDRLEELNIEYKLDTMVLDVSSDKRIKAINPVDGYIEIKAKAVVLAMGCRERTRGAIMVPGTRPAGIYTAGMAQRLINIEGYMVGKKAVILGSGDIGLIMARRLTLEGAKVEAVVELMPYSGGLKRNIAQCLDDFDIPLLLSHTVTKVSGTDRLKKVEIAAVDANRNIVESSKRVFDCDTMLLSVGLIPENELSMRCGIELDKITGGPVVDDSMQTCVEGIFACGNVVHVHDLVDFVTEESIRAGAAAASFVSSSGVVTATKISTKPGNSIRYIVPQIINPSEIDSDLDLFFRCDNVYNDVSLVVDVNGTEIKRLKKRYLAPGEMEHIRINRKALRKGENDSIISVSIEKDYTYGNYKNDLRNMPVRMSVGG